MKNFYNNFILSISSILFPTYDKRVGERKKMRNVIFASIMALSLVGCQQTRVTTFSNNLCIAIQKSESLVVNCPTEAGRHVQELLIK